MSRLLKYIDFVNDNGSVVFSFLLLVMFFFSMEVSVASQNMQSFSRDLGFEAFRLKLV